MYGVIAILLVLVGAGGYLLSMYTQPSVGSDLSVLDCAAPTGKTEPMPTTKLYFEYNSTDEDTGIHGLFDTTSFSELCVYDPNGKQILTVKPQGTLKGLNMAGIFFESREPKHSEVSVGKHMQDFPEGLYSIKAVNFAGVGLTGAATLTHTIPAPPTIIAPKGDVTVPHDDVVVRWDPVTTSTKGGPITITGYEVIVTNEDRKDPHGFSQPVYDVHVIPSVTSLTVPKEFLEPGTKYELEVLALETSGNQTITVDFFQTAGTPVSASAQKPSAPASSGNISESQARSIALGRVSGTVTDLVLDTRSGKKVYVVEVTPTSGTESDVVIDAQTGAILAVE